jgi:hypothetical protein
VLFGIIGIVYAFTRAAIVDPETVRFHHFPEVQTMYPVALTAALEERPDARSIIIEVVSHERLYEEALEYETRFYFCSPTDDTWLLGLGAVRHFNPLGGDIKLTRLNVSDSEYLFYTSSCDRYSIGGLNYGIESVVDSMRSSLPEGELAGLEIKPRWMKLTRNQQGILQWEAVFKYAWADYALRIVFDAEKGTLESVEGTEFLEYESHEFY